MPRGDQGGADLTRLLEEGFASLERQDFARAATQLAAAHRLRPLDAGLALACANAQQLGDQPLAARATLQRFVASDADVSIEECFALGTALLQLGAPSDAATCFEQVVAVRGDDPAALAALASALRSAGDLARAWPLAERAVTLAPTNAAFQLTAGQVRHELGDLAGATTWLAKAARLRPDHAPTRLQQAYTALLAQPSADGWSLFESRPLPEPGTSARPWHGESLRGSSVLVTAEQGVGDQFQFARFIPLLRERGADRVVVQCHAGAVSLFAGSGFEAVARHATPGVAPTTDWHVPMLSLPHRLGLDADVQGARVPYLRAPAPRADEAALLPARGARPRLGLVWAGNPAFVGRMTRDLDVRLLPRLVSRTDVEWWALQVGAAADDAPASVHRAPPPRSWADTAAMLATLDGLVTTDTGIAHLAGAMGVRTWVLLQHVPDWRWTLTGARTPWYPSLTLLRQPAPGDWSSVIGQLQSSLEGTITSKETSDA